MALSKKGSLARVQAKAVIVPIRLGCEQGHTSISPGVMIGFPEDSLSGDTIARPNQERPLGTQMAMFKSTCPLSS